MQYQFPLEGPSLLAEYLRPFVHQPAQNGSGANNIKTKRRRRREGEDKRRFKRI